MFGFLKKLFGNTPVEVTKPEAAPYKVEVAPTPTPVAQQASEAAVKSVAKPAPKKQGAKKPAAPKKPAGAKKGPKKAKSTKA